MAKSKSKRSSRKVHYAPLCDFEQQSFATNTCNQIQPKLDDVLRTPPTNMRNGRSKHRRDMAPYVPARIESVKINCDYPPVPDVLSTPPQNRTVPHKNVSRYAVPFKKHPANSFLGLPGEIRNIIYQYCFHTPSNEIEIESEMKMSADVKHYPVALFRVDRQISYEARTSFYCNQHFSFALPSFFHEFGEKIGTNLALLRHVEIQWVGYFDNLKEASKSYNLRLTNRTRLLRSRDYKGNVLAMLPSQNTLSDFKIRCLAFQDLTLRTEPHIAEGLIAAAQHIHVGLVDFTRADTKRMCSWIAKSPSLESLYIRKIFYTEEGDPATIIARYLMTHLGEWFRRLSLSMSTVSLFRDALLLFNERFLNPCEWARPNTLRIKGSLVSYVCIMTEMDKLLRCENTS